MPENRKRYGMARVAYRKVQAEVEQKLAEGYTQRMIYEQLTANGSLDISYASFLDYVRGQGQRQHSRNKNPTPVVKPTSKNPRPATPVVPDVSKNPRPVTPVVPDESKTFVYESNLPWNKLV